MSEKVADKNYFLDAEGNVTTDSTKASEWLAREGTAITKEISEKYGIPTAPEAEKVAQPEAEKSEKPAKNKATAPKKNKGAK